MLLELGVVGKRLRFSFLTGGNTGGESDISAVRVAGFGKVQTC